MRRFLALAAITMALTGCASQLAMTAVDLLVPRDYPVVCETDTSGQPVCH